MSAERAGGVVRRGRHPRLILIVQQRRTGRWGLPKGHVEKGERPIEAALREVEEETGYRCRVVRKLPTMTSWDERGRSRTTHFWEMTPVERVSEIQDADEIASVAWAPQEDALKMIARIEEREILASSMRFGARSSGRGSGDMP